ncbi:hypothetical protein ABZZ79_14830 [Streptomyces sp. NPDC006458]|uniref:hypothetical protein n=1 Tax=Streptomyces sp. NPDC006458 TaxID=3154302 RepID=UPI0033A1EA3A
MLVTGVIGVCAAPGVAAAGPRGSVTAGVRVVGATWAGVPVVGASAGMPRAGVGAEPVRPLAEGGRPDRPGGASPPVRGLASPGWEGRDGSALPSPSFHGSGPAHRPAAHGPRAEESARAADEGRHPAAESSRAGSRAGEGQDRPGRREDALKPEEPENAESAQEEEGAANTGRADEAAEDPAEDSGADEEADEEQGSDTGSVGPSAPQASARPPSAAVPPASTQPIAPQAGVRAEPVLEVLPLGSGLVLIGLGLGLAFVGLRLRRG